MGKKNIQPTTSSPVSRTLVVAPRPALEELRAEPQEGHISSLTGPEPTWERPTESWGYVASPLGGFGDVYEVIYSSYDGDDE